MRVTDYILALSVCIELHPTKAPRITNRHSLISGDTPKTPALDIYWKQYILLDPLLKTSRAPKTNKELHRLTPGSMYFLENSTFSPHILMGLCV